MVKLNKKAMEMSLNLIIMLIIGMVILGLVIGFVNSLVNKGTQNFNRQLDDNEKYQLTEVAKCAENLCIKPSPTVTVKRGSDNPIYIKVRGFNGEVKCLAGTNLYGSTACDAGNLALTVVDSSGNAITGTTKLVGPLLNAPDGKEDAQRFIFTTEISPGTYFATLTLTPGTSTTPETKAFTIVVE